MTFSLSLSSSFPPPSLLISAPPFPPPVYLVLGIPPRALCMLWKHSTIELHPSPWFTYVNNTEGHHHSENRLQKRLFHGGPLRSLALTIFLSLFFPHDPWVLGRQGWYTCLICGWTPHWQLLSALWQVVSFCVNHHCALIYGYRGTAVYL